MWELCQNKYGRQKPTTEITMKLQPGRHTRKTRRGTTHPTINIMMRNHENSRTIQKLEGIAEPVAALQSTQLQFRNAIINLNLGDIMPKAGSLIELVIKVDAHSMRSHYY